MSVTWGAPADPNGVILSYHLFVTLNSSDAVYLPGNPDMNITIEDPAATMYDSFIVYYNCAYSS